MVRLGPAGAGFATLVMLLVLLVLSAAAVTHTSPARCPACPPHTAWMPQPCSWNDMVAAAMSYDLVRAVSQWQE
jgi:hypothetical protein